MLKEKINEKLFSDADYLRTVLDASPTAFFVVDNDVRILDMNLAGFQLSGPSSEILLRRLCGEILHCIRIERSDEECGKTEFCPDCVIRNAVQESAQGQRVVRRKTDMQLKEKGQARDVCFLVTTSPFQYDGASLILLALEEITDLKQAEEKIKASLQEKEILLKELHHRVKNNFQMVASLLSLQANRLQDRIAIEALFETQKRVRAMASVHDLLSRSEDCLWVDMDLYVQEVVRGLESFNNRADIAVNVEVDAVRFKVETAIPIGLVITELVTNAFKHAFVSKTEGSLTIRLQPVNDDKKNRCELVISDTGLGLPDTIDLEKTKTLGLGLVKILTKQLHGTVEVDVNGGTTFRIVFPVPQR